MAIHFIAHAAISALSLPIRRLIVRNNEKHRRPFRTAELRCSERDDQTSASSSLIGFFSAISMPVVTSVPTTIESA